VDKQDVHKAAIATTGHGDGPRDANGRYRDFDSDVPVILTINARGRACLIHSGEFEATPVWVKYLTDKRKIQLVYDNGTSRTINFIMNDKLHKKLLNITKLFLIRTDNGKPVEGYDTTLLKE
jgi:hypothetical protein